MQEQKYAVLSYFTAFEKRDCFRWLSQMPLFNFIFWREEMVGLFDFRFVRKSFLFVRPPKIWNNRIKCGPGPSEMSWSPRFLKVPRSQQERSLKKWNNRIFGPLIGEERYAIDIKVQD